MIRPPPRATLFPYTTLVPSGHDADPLTAAHRNARARLRSRRSLWLGRSHAPARTRHRAGHRGVDRARRRARARRSEEHTSELQSRQYLVCRLLLEKNTATEL